MPTTVTDLKEFPAEFTEFILRLVPLLGLEVSKEVVRQLWLEVGETSPIGHPLQDRHPGKYQLSWTVGVGELSFKQLPDLPGYPRLSAPEADDALAGAEPGMSLYIGNAAADDRRPDSSYSASLEAGRRTVNGREYGSLQAPHGIAGPAVAVVYSKRDTITAKAIEATEAKIG